MFLLPLRTKNPPEGFPYCTLALIAINFVVYFSTTHDFVVTGWALDNLGVSYNNLGFQHLITAMFLHESPLHILGNMFFLWLFGPAVEGRLKAWKFLAIYFTAGLLGGLIFEVVIGAQFPDRPSLGASGAIMGVLGAYMYMFPFSQVSVFWIFLIRFGVAQWQAMWFIGFYVVQDIVFGYFQLNDGTAHVAHLGGFALGYLIALMLRPRIDSLGYSLVKSTLSEFKDIRILNMRELEVLVHEPTVEPDVVLTYCSRVMCNGEDRNYQRGVELLRTHFKMLVERGDPVQFARLLLSLPPSEKPLDGIVYVRVGTRLEQTGETDLAYLVYHRLLEMDSGGRDAESALYRIARLLETTYSNPQAALETYTAMLKQFPTGSMALEGEAAVSRMKAAISPLQRTDAPTWRSLQSGSETQHVDKPRLTDGGTPLGTGRMLET